MIYLAYFCGFGAFMLCLWFGFASRHYGVSRRQFVLESVLAAGVIIGLCMLYKAAIEAGWLPGPGGAGR